MSNWLFALCMLIVAVVLNMIVTFFMKTSRVLKGKRRKTEKDSEIVTVMSAEYIDKDFLGRTIGSEKEKVESRN
ncbi:hypothetical protein IEE_05476 [Bacillus cereus BAG5X1-1]|uniref:Uncharacterized protein n=1 Tax=Bacillus cereus BAG5X1-1 TaxID=1053189 RepID=J8A913_BACCE|nr:hypothetical protein [Bacillus cereus]EJQ36000.1 hypothetical protein IEE_05476 [Bacillus cereus BAG5X1-1]